MGIPSINVVIDINETGVIQSYKICDKNLNTQDLTLERLKGKDLFFNCPCCKISIELVLYLSGFNVEVLHDPEESFKTDKEVVSDQFLEEYDEAIEECTDDFEMTEDINFEDDVRYEEEVVIDVNSIDFVDMKQHRRTVRIVKEQAALANEEFKCDKCKECFRYNAALINHEKKCLSAIQKFEASVKLEAGLDCSKCSQKFKSKAGLVMHQRNCIGDKIAFCYDCQTLYKSQLVLKKHIRAVHQPNTYACGECGSQFKKRWLLDEHVLKHKTASSKPFICDFCDKRFANKNTIKLHILSTHSTGPIGYKCPLCPDSINFVNNSKLRHHVTKLHSNNDCICNVCCKLFGDPTELQDHAISSHFNEEQLVYKCEYCDFTSTVRSITENHQLSHVPKSEWPFACETCGKRFKKKDNCRRHETIHTGKKDFACGICGATFRLGYQVTQHMAVHRSNKKQGNDRGVARKLK